MQDGGADFQATSQVDLQQAAIEARPSPEKQKELNEERLER